MTQPTNIIVTGAAQGIGRAVALRLATEGAHIAIWDTLFDGAEETAQMCRAAGATARAWRVDVGVPDEIDRAVAEFVREWGAPDGLVNNAGIFPRAHALDIDLNQWESVLRINLTGTFWCARQVGAHMKEAGRGVIVNTSSNRGLGGAAEGAHYASSKAGIIALTKSLALDWAAHGIRVNCVVPGLTDTAQPRAGNRRDSDVYRAGARTPLGRIGKPEEIASVVAFLLSDDSRYMTGQSIAVNGGSIMIP